MSDKCGHSCENWCWVAQDERERCNAPATEQINGEWYCPNCAKFKKEALEKERIRQSRGIRVSADGDIILPYSADSSETAKLSSCIGTHHICRGWVDIRQTTPNKHILHCRECGLRIALPLEIDTFEKIRKYFNDRVL